MIRAYILSIIFHLCLYSCIRDNTTSGYESTPSNEPREIGLDKSIEEFHHILNTMQDFQKILRVVGKCNHRYGSTVQKLDFGTYYINEYVGTNDGVQMHVKYLIQDSSLIYGVVVSTNSSLHSQLKGEVFYKDRNMLQDFIVAHNRFYHKDYSIEQVIQEVIESDFAVTIACGNGSVNYGQEEIRLFRAVRDKDIDYIDDMLRSISPERQVLGVIAVQKLIESNFNPTQNMIQIKDHILEKNSLISACISCSYGGTYKTVDYLARYKWALVPNIYLD